jgi:hypothetical protein
MKRKDWEMLIEGTVRRLSDLSAMDRAVIQPQSQSPVTIPLEELLRYGERYEERQRLHDQLRRLASEKVED